MNSRKATDKDKPNILNLIPKDRSAQNAILNCFYNLTDEEREILLDNPEFIPHSTLSDHGEAISYVDDDADAFVHEYIRRFLAKRKLPEDIKRVNIKSLLASLFPSEPETTHSEYRDVILKFRYKEFCDFRQDRKDYLNNLLKEYKFIQRQNTDLFQKTDHAYKKKLIQDNKKNLKNLIKRVKTYLEDKDLRLYASLKLSTYKFKYMYNNYFIDYFPPAEMYSPEVIDQRFQWMQHLPAGDYFKIINTQDLTILSKHIPRFMNSLKEYLSNGSFSLENKSQSDAIIEAIDAFEAGFKRAAITLMIRENEGLVWELARQIAAKHNIFFDKRKKQLKMDNHAEIQEKTSLRQLLAVEDWPRIFKGPHGKLTLGERLGFLALDYNNERNLIVHGITTDFDVDWKWFELISACMSIIEAYEELNGWNEEEEEFSELIKSLQRGLKT
ncbi:hypothetical protein [Paenibacillus sp. Leaf72]|uniref:hypothetical protein n=1 Tax=Paenibacillus sp. Leaf72 TaxID=1736234 RepID=UPI0006FA4485|nr:hypothetical protein [Paenibacillus sp. Leaf72]KQN96943.1 hypothetical protein ASF12_23015 [Paenibacillus sp. Leaf72]